MNTAAVVSLEARESNQTQIVRDRWPNYKEGCYFLMENSSTKQDGDQFSTFLVERLLRQLITTFCVFFCHFDM